MNRHVPRLGGRHQGHRGETIPTHRALYRLEIDPARHVEAVLVALSLAAIWALSLPAVMHLWSSMIGFSLQALDLPASAPLVLQAQWGVLELTVPHVALGAAAPTAWQWSLGLAVTAIALLVSVLLPDRLLPLSYGLRLLAFVQISSQIVFAVAPSGFPYDIPGYTEVLFIANVFVIGLSPLVLCLTYSPLDFHLRHQVLLFVSTMLHLAVFVPLQYTAHAWLIHQGSLLWMPLLFWAFGLTLDVAVIVALYGWAVGWEKLPFHPPRHVHRRRREIGFTLLLLGASALAATPARADDAPPMRWTASAGADFGRYTDGLGDSDGQSLSLERSRAGLDRLRFDLGRAARFGDEGIGIGAGLFRHLGENTIVSGGLSTGTGDVIFPRWRVDLGVRRTGLAGGGLLVDLGYTHVQSKAENSTDGIGAGLFWYLRGPWAVGLDGRIDVGHPGSTRGYNVGTSLHWSIYRKLYLGARVETGRVAYTLVGPQDALVEYDSRGARAGVTWYARPDLGAALEFSVVDTEFYTLRGLGLRVFREW